MELHSPPGEFHLERGEEQLNPYQLMPQLSDGVISKEAWLTKCKTLGIEDIALANGAERAGTAKQEALPLG